MVAGRRDVFSGEILPNHVAPSVRRCCSDVVDEEGRFAEEGRTLTQWPSTAAPDDLTAGDERARRFCADVIRANTLCTSNTFVYKHIYIYISCKYRSMV